MVCSDGLNGSGRASCFHPEFLALYGCYCMQPIACQRIDPESKGIVEASVRYVKRNALAGLADELVRFEDYCRVGTPVARRKRKRPAAKNRMRKTPGRRP
jgi:transposase